MKITIIVENTVQPRRNQYFLGQHGLAMVVDIPDCGSFLFDCGQADVLMHNLLLMDISPDSIDYAVLSHGHDSHCGGLLSFLRARRMPLTVFAGPGLFSPRYCQNASGVDQFVGVPHTKELLVTSGADFIFTSGATRIRNDIWLSGPIPKITDFETESIELINANKQTDRFADEIAAYVVLPQGLVVLTGCAHRGIVNTIKYGQKITGVDKVHAVVGGTHLEYASEKQRKATIDFLEQLNPDLLAFNHCTGPSMQGALQSIFGSRFISANCGSVIDL